MPRELKQAPEQLFWHWINERHAIYQRRAAGQAKPWTDDPILRDYKFTNVFRQLDAGTVWLTEHFIQPHWDDDPALVVGNVGWYRMFNFIGTGARLGWQTKWQQRYIVPKLRRAHARGEQVFTGAHIVYSAGGRPKLEKVFEYCGGIWRARKAIVAVAERSKTLEAAFDILVELPGVGPFMAYEIVSDLRHTRMLQEASDVDTWANVGPGALRGLRRLWPGMPASYGLEAMRWLLARSRWPVLGPHMPPLELRDIEHSLCEFDKYCRVKFGEGRPRSTYPGAA